jgi:hypothetical protein
MKPLTSAIKQSTQQSFVSKGRTKREDHKSKPEEQNPKLSHKGRAKEQQIPSRIS